MEKSDRLFFFWLVVLGGFIFGVFFFWLFFFGVFGFFGMVLNWLFCVFLLVFLFSCRSLLQCSPPGGPKGRAEEEATPH